MKKETGGSAGACTPLLLCMTNETGKRATPGATFSGLVTKKPAGAGHHGAGAPLAAQAAHRPAARASAAARTAKPGL